MPEAFDGTRKWRYNRYSSVSFASFRKEKVGEVCYMRVIDLSQPIYELMPVYPGDVPVSLELSKTPERDGYTAYILRSGLHAGTHIDMPSHLTDDTRTAADFDPSSFIGTGVLLDVRGEDPIEMKPEYRDLALDGSIVLLWTGYDQLFHEDAYFAKHPSLSNELASYLLRGGIKMLGADAPAPDHPPFPIHKLLLENGVFILENLANLDALSGLNRFTVCALPLKIDAEASLVRAVALVEDL